MVCEFGAYLCVLQVSPTNRKLPPGSAIVPSWATMASSVLESDTGKLEQSGCLLINNKNTSVGAAHAAEETAPASSEGTGISRGLKLPSARNSNESGRNTANKAFDIHVEEPVPTASTDSIPTIEKYAPWKPPKFQSKSHAEREYEKRLMRKLGHNGDLSTLHHSASMETINVPYIHKELSDGLGSKYKSSKLSNDMIMNFTNQSSNILENNSSVYNM